MDPYISLSPAMDIVHRLISVHGIGTLLQRETSIGKFESRNKFSGSYETGISDHHHMI